MLSEEEILASFDVVSLLTNIPTDLAVDIARSHLEKDTTLADRRTLDVEEIIMLLQ